MKAANVATAPSSSTFGWPLAIERKLIASAATSATIEAAASDSRCAMTLKSTHGTNAM